MMTKNLPPTIAASESPRDSARNRRTRPVADVDFSSQREKELRELKAKQEAENKPASVKTVITQPKKETPKAEQPKPEQKPLGDWNEDILAKDHSLPLPERKQTIGLSESKPVELAKINVRDPSSIDLKLHSASNGSNAGGFVFQVDDEESDEGVKLRRWIVQKKVPNPLGSKELGTDFDVGEVGRFELADQRFAFVWNMEASKSEKYKPLSLQYCLLEISKGEGKEQELCRLSEPRHPESRSLDPASRGNELALVINSSAVEDPSTLILDLRADGVASKPFEKKGMRVGETASFTIKRNVAPGDGDVELDLSFQYDKQGPRLEVAANTFRNVLVDKKKNKNEEMETISLARKEAHKIPLERMKFATNLSDFERIKKNSQTVVDNLRGSKYLVKIKTERSKKAKYVGSLREDLKNAKPEDKGGIQSQIDTLERSINGLDEIVGGYDERIKAAQTNIGWSNAMAPEFEALVKSVRIGYSIYIEVKGQKVYLARSKSEVENATPDDKKPDDKKPDDKRGDGP